MTGWFGKGRLGRPFRFSSTSSDLPARCLRAVGLALLFLGWNAPNHYPPWPVFHLELFAAIGTCLIGAAGFASRGPGAARPDAARLPMPTAARVWALAALLPVVQYAAGGLAFRGDALIGLLYGLGVALAIYVGLLWAAQQGRDTVLRTLWLTIVVGALAANGLALVQWLRLGTPGWWAMELIDHRPYGNFAQPNHFGLLMVLAIVAVTALFEMRSVQQRWVYAVAATFFGWGVLISESRASALALIVLAACWLLTRKRVATRLRPADLAVALLIAGTMYVAVEPLQGLFLLKSTEFRAATEVGPRQAIWLHFWAAINERPWFGYGFNQAVMALAEVADQVQPSRNVVFAHNLVLDLMTWVGIPMALLLTAALALWTLGWLRAGREPALTTQRHLVFGVWMAMLVQSMLEFPYAHSYFLLPAALLAGAVTGSPAVAPAPNDDRAATPTRWVLALAAGAVLLLGITTWEYLRLEDDFRINRFARANFGALPSHQALEQPWVLDQLGALNASAQVVAKPGMSPAQIESMHRLARRFHILSVRLEYAKALALNGRMAEAELEMQIIRSVCPPATYQSLERHWRSWLVTQADEVRRSGPGSN